MEECKLFVIKCADGVYLGNFAWTKRQYALEFETKDDARAEIKRRGFTEGNSIKVVYEPAFQ
jgi:hypothetical protein